jgi:hypothetical protein
MSNRSKWAHWKKLKPERHPLLKKWSVGIAFIVLGILLFLSGLQGLGDHVFWYKSFSFHLGTPVVHQTADLIIFGTVFLLAGITIVVARK